MKEVMENQRIQYSNSVILYFLTTKVSMVLCMFDLTFISDINNPRNRFLPIPLYFPCLPEFEKGSRLFIYVYCSGISRTILSMFKQQFSTSEKPSTKTRALSLKYI